MSGVRVTGLGSMPGTDFAATQRMVLGEGLDLPWLVELPDRGVGSQMVGRTGALLDGVALDLQPAGWRLTENAGADARRAQTDWRRDLDVLEELAQGYAGPLKLAVTGPWTMAAMVEKPRGDKVVSDHGARRDLAGALAHGVAGVVAELGRRLPEVEVVLQVDEPLLPRVLAGQVATASGFSRHRRVHAPEASEALGQAVAEAGVRAALHCCAPGLDVDLAYGAGFAAVSLDQRHIDARTWDRLAAALDAGREVWLGCAPTHQPDAVPRPDRLAERALAGVRPLEVAATADHLWLTPACGLAGWSPRGALALLRALREAAGLVTEGLER
ncbi:uroporphyrinogen decarboxylase/cobalamine-independent methonine synthase family protein [Mariniluteicoccus flavus]